MFAVSSESGTSLPVHINRGKGYDYALWNPGLQDLTDFSHKKKNLKEKCVISKELIGKMENIISH